MLPDTLRSAMTEVLGWSAPPKVTQSIAHTQLPEPGDAKLLVMSWPEPWIRIQRLVGGSK